MDTFLDIAFSPVNIVLTILLCILVLYWVLTMMTGVDFDFDIDVDVDVDMDVDIDADAGIEGGNMDFQDISNAEVNKEDLVGKRRKPLRWWQIILIYFNFVGLPFMFTFTSWIFIWWICTTITTTITGSYAHSLGYLILLGGSVPALFLTKIFTTPFKGFFKNLNQDGDDPIDMIGRAGNIQSSISGNKLGSATVTAEGNPMSIYVKSLTGEPIAFNAKILIIKESEDQNFYFVQAYED